MTKAKKTSARYRRQNRDCRAVTCQKAEAIADIAECGFHDVLPFHGATKNPPTAGLRFMLPPRRGLAAPPQQESSAHDGRVSGDSIPILSGQLTTVLRASQENAVVRRTPIFETFDYIDIASPDRRCWRRRHFKCRVGFLKKSRSMMSERTVETVPYFIWSAAAEQS